MTKKNNFLLAEIKPSDSWIEYKTKNILTSIELYEYTKDKEKLKRDIESQLKQLNFAGEDK